ncbi:hypothetical protein ACOMHN_015558 [Nucella lapillus]
MEHPFFLLDVRLQEGVDLVIRDSCGFYVRIPYVIWQTMEEIAPRTSDPYVKFKIAGKQVYRSRTIYKNLNPKWEESFTIPIEDIAKPLYLKVFDYDRGLHDDPMGNALIDISQMELGNNNNSNNNAHSSNSNNNNNNNNSRKLQQLFSLSIPTLNPT